MHDPPGGFRPVRRIDGYLPLEDYGLIGDGTTAALVGRDGCVAWLCLPRFDSPPIFCSLLDEGRGGGFRIAPEEATGARQRYEPDTGVLVTEWRTAGGMVRITDALALRSGADLSEDASAGRSELVRALEVVEGAARISVDVDPRGGAEAERQGGGLRLRCRAHPELDLYLDSSRPLEGLRSVHELNAGDRLELVLRWSEGSHRHRSPEPAALLRQTADAWGTWMGCFHYDGPQEPMVRRSTITLKMLDHLPSGALVAAPTSSLPEAIGGPRNWDYRYAWIRDAAFSVYAFRRIGLTSEAWGFLGWVLDSVERAGRAAVLYDLDGSAPPAEWEDPDLEGYRRSAPVRWGNGAADQVQNDAYGEILDCAYQWAAQGGRIPLTLWQRLIPLVEEARKVWWQPDHGIWEVRTSGHVFTYSVAMCQVALDRAARLATRLKLPGNAGVWAAEAAAMKAALLEEAWDPDRRTLTEHLGGGGLDASLLSLPLRRVLEATHPRMVATTEAVAKVLGAGQGLIYRYLPEESPDGLEGEEGAFLLCSFWLVDNLTYQGRLDEAQELYESLCARGGELGLLPEQIDPETGAFLGNHPQAFSHVGVISSGVNLGRRLKGGE